MNSLTSPALLEIKRESVTATGEFSGYAATFSQTPDLDNDIILKGAFLNSIRQHKRDDTMPAMLWAHLHYEPVGKWLSMDEDNHGLLVAGRLTLETARGAAAHSLLADGAISLSIGYTVPRGGATRSGGIRRIRECNCREVSLVAMPSNINAKIIGKAARPETRRQYEHLLRTTAGLSVREAKRAASGGWGALVRNVQEDTDATGRKLDSLGHDVKEILSRVKRG